MINIKNDKTTNFDEFVILELNRPLIDIHVKNLMESITDNPQLTELSPIVVNEKLAVIDGQHRLEAHKRLASLGHIYPIHYIIREGFNIKNAQQMNSLSKTWGLVDYARIEAQSNLNYRIFMDALGTRKLSAETIILYLSGKAAKHTGFKKGQFQVKEVIRAEELFNNLCEVGELLQREKITPASFWKSTNFTRALYNVMNYLNYNQERMLETLKTRGDALNASKNRVVDLEETLKSIYNRGAEKKLRKMAR